MGKVFTQWKMLIMEDDDYMELPRTDVEHEQAKYVALHLEPPEAFRPKGSRRTGSEPPIPKGRSHCSGHRYFGPNESLLLQMPVPWVLPPQPEGWTICADGSVKRVT